MGLQALYKSISRNERILLLCVFIVAVMSTTAPYVIGWSQRGDRQFLWSNYLSWMDYSVYYSYINQAVDGAIVFKNYFTSEPQIGGMINIFWLGVGWLAKLFGLSAQAVFHIARIFWIGSFVVVVYAFIAYIFKDLRYRILALFFVLFSGGIGAIVRDIRDALGYSDKQAEAAIASAFKYAPFPIDLWVPDANTYLMLKQSSHLIASITLMLVVFLFILFALEMKKLRYSAVAGFVAMVLFQFHPYQVGIIFGVIGIYFFILLISKKETISHLIKHAGVLFVCSAPSIMYYAWLLVSDWRTKQLAVENICITPPPIYVFLGYGAVFVLAVVGVICITRTRELMSNRGYLFLVAWTATQILLIYTPVDFQRRLIMGLHIVLALLASVGVIYIVDRIGVLVRGRRVAYASLLLLLLFSFTMPGADFENSVWFYKNNDWFFVSPKKQEAMRWLRDNLKESDVVLSSWGNGNVIAGELQKRVFLGHWAETADIETKTDELAVLFAKPNNQKRIHDYFIHNGITHFFFSPSSPEIQYFETNPETYSVDFSNSEFRIYSLKK